MCGPVHEAGMSGLLFLTTVVLWLCVLKWVVNKIGRRMPDRPWRRFAKFGIFALLLPLPLIDEIVGGQQFAHLCESNVVHVNKATAHGKTVYAEGGTYEQPVPGMWVKIWKMPSRYLDAETGEVVLSFDQLRAEGGRFFPGFDSGHDPLTFKGTCHPSGVLDKRFYVDLGLTRIEKAQSK
jgi:hypothetical protein